MFLLIAQAENSTYYYWHLSSVHSVRPAQKLLLSYISIVLKHQADVNTIGNQVIKGGPKIMLLFSKKIIIYKGRTDRSKLVI